MQPVLGSWHVLLRLFWWPVSNELFISLNKQLQRPTLPHFSFKEQVRRAQRPHTNVALYVVVGIALDVCKGKQVLHLPNTHLLWAAATSSLCMSF